MGAFTKMVTFLWFLRILTSLNSRVKGVLSAAFCLPEVPLRPISGSVRVEMGS